MKAIESYIDGLQKIEDTVASYSNSMSADPSLSDIILRGAGLRAFTLFENFVTERSADWAHALSNRGVPTVLGKFEGSAAINALAYVQRLMANTSSKLSSNRFSGVEVESIVKEVGDSLSSFSQNTLKFNKTFFLWKGSNILLSDLDGICQFVGVGDSKRLIILAKKIDPNSETVKELFTFSADLRHKIAHDPNYPVDVNSILASVAKLKILASILDIGICAGVESITDNSRGSLDLNKVVFRKLYKDKDGWRETHRNSEKTRKRYNKKSQGDMKDGQWLATCMAEASKNLKSSDEALLVFDDNGDLISWRSFL